MDYDSTSRCYAFLGHKYYVNVEYNMNVDVMGNESKMPCNRSLDGEYDECAYKMVTFSSGVGTVGPSYLNVFSKLRSRLMQKFNCTVPWVPDPLVCNWTTPNITDVVTEYEMQLFLENSPLL